MTKHEGIIVRLNPDGLGVVQEPLRKESFAFTFDKIEGYAGEAPGELGLREGTKVLFAEQDEEVTLVELIE